MVSTMSLTSKFSATSPRTSELSLDKLFLCKVYTFREQGLLIAIKDIKLPVGFTGVRTT